MPLFVLLIVPEAVTSTALPIVLLAALQLAQITVLTVVMKAVRVIVKTRTVKTRIANLNAILHALVLVVGTAQASVQVAVVMTVIEIAVQDAL